LAALANEHGGEDNITAVVVRIDTAQDPAQADQQPNSQAAQSSGAPA
jgi:serine/threonine protein phosphatase PrpC